LKNILFIAQNNMSLANKYRPVDFDSTIWQSHISDILKSKIKNNNFTNCNYIFYWPRGTWKTSTARILSKAMNCLDLHDWNPCNKCANCTAINEWSTLDYVEIDAASYTWVDNIRDEILSKVEYVPTQLKKKIYVIDEVHMLSKSAFNALLKTIEEPKDYMVFILATTDIHKVPDTVISRCQVFNFKKVWKEDMMNHLKDICESEKLQYDMDALELISKISEWCMRDAIKYVDQVSVFGNINVENVTNFLWIAGDKLIGDFLEAIKSWDKEKIFAMVDDIASRWIDLAQLTKQIIVYIDQNLATDMEFLLSVSEIFGDINATIRYYPYPNIAYKIAINKYLNWDTSKQTDTPRAEKVATRPTVQKSTPTPTVQSQAPSQPAPSTVDTKSEVKTETITTSQTTNIDSTDTEQIKNQLIDRLSNNTTKNMFKDYVFIQWMEWNTITFIIINKIAEISLKKDEKEIEQILNEILGHPVVIETKFQDKNEFFASQLL